MTFLLMIKTTAKNLRVTLSRKHLTRSRNQIRATKSLEYMFHNIKWRPTSVIKKHSQPSETDFSPPPPPPPPKEKNSAKLPSPLPLNGCSQQQISNLTFGLIGQLYTDFLVPLNQQYEALFYVCEKKEPVWPGTHERADNYIQTSPAQ